MRLLAAFFVLVTIPTTALACLTSPEPAFDRMIRDSTLIIRGQVLRETGDKQWNIQGTKLHQSDILVERVYKGAAPRAIHVGWKEYTLCPRAHLNKDQYGLLFLRATGSEFVFVDETYGNLAVSRWQEDFPQDDSQSLDPLVAIERDLKRAIKKDSGRQLIEDLSLLGSLRRPIDTAEILALLPANDQVLEGAVHLALLKLHDYSKLEEAGKLVETVESRSFILPKQEAASLRADIGWEIHGIKDPGQLPLLQRFTLSSNYWLRQNATRALRQLHNPSNVRYLIRLIDDPWPETRLEAMRGLQELVRPGLQEHGWVLASQYRELDSAEKEVVARWRAWWEKEGKTKYGK